MHSTPRGQPKATSILPGAPSGGCHQRPAAFPSSVGGVCPSPHLLLFWSSRLAALSLHSQTPFCSRWDSVPWARPGSHVPHLSWAKCRSQRDGGAGGCPSSHGPPTVGMRDGGTVASNLQAQGRCWAWAGHVARRRESLRVSQRAASLPGPRRVAGVGSARVNTADETCVSREVAFWPGD